jgi:uncharacterized delta-60 repeat protein
VAFWLGTTAQLANGQLLVAAHDEAGNYVTPGSCTTTWTNGSTGGFGFGPWVLTDTGDFGSGYYIGNGSDGQGAALSTTNPCNVACAWGFYSDGAYGSTAAVGYRAFTGSLVPDMTFKIKWRTEATNPALGGVGGFSLRNGNDLYYQDNGSRFDCFFEYAGTNSFLVQDANGIWPLGIPLTAQGLQVEFTLLTADTYRLVVRTADGSTILATLTDQPLAGAGSIDSVALYDYQTPYPGDQIFNVMEILSPPIPPVIIEGPTNLSAVFGDSLSFNVTAGGPLPTYQWRKNGENLADGENLSGTTTPTLTIGSASGADAGGYSVVVSNAYGIVTSQVAALTVQDPLIISQPGGGGQPPAGFNWNMNVSASGTPPLGYQWRKNGTNLADGGSVSGATTATLTFNNLSGADTGGYSVVVSNAYGMVTSQFATLTVRDPFITSQPVNVRTNVGGTAVFRVAAGGTAPLSYQWRKGGAVLPAATAASLTLTNLQYSDSGYYSVVVKGPYGSVTSLVATLTIPAADPLNPGAVGRYVESLAVQPDGKILAGGVFTQLGGQTRPYIGRLNTDGSLDSGFNPGASNSSNALNVAVNCLGLQPDGTILAGGVFNELAGQPCDSIGRLNADGTPDPGFNTGTTNHYFYLNCLAAQPDGKILVGGGFPALRRLNPDGTADTNFNASLSAGGTLYCAVLQPDGKILVGGGFTSLAGQSRTNIGRLNPDGTLDTNFVAAATGSSGGGWNPGVITMAVQPDGKILVGGNFSSLDGRVHPGFGRLNADGTLDTNFTVQVTDIVHSLGLQTDGKIVLGGQFIGLMPRQGQLQVFSPGIGRVNADGTIDTNYIPQVVPPYVLSLALQPDGKVVVGGQFSQVSGLYRTNIARLYNTGPATSDLKYDGSAIAWLRGGTSPEVWRTTFDYSADGTNWTSLGAGTRISGGWQLVTNVPTPGSVSIRARGYVTGGHYNASGSFVETIITASSPAILTGPSGRTNNVGTDATFTVLADGTPQLGYQWRKDGTNIPDGTNATLVLKAVQKADQGLYSVIVSSPFGFATSTDALLHVNLPPVADASATKPFVISPNGIDATVILDGTRSGDPDGDLLHYAWYEAGDATPLANGAVAVVTLPDGAHSLLLVVSDGLLDATNAFTVEVASTAQAVKDLMDQVSSSWPHSQPLLATLSAALVSIERGNAVSAVNQLLAFQNKVRAQVAPNDSGLAEAYIEAARQIIDVLSAGNTNPGGRPRGKFTAVNHQANGRVQLQFSAASGPNQIVEASSNLVDWEMIGVAVAHGDGTFTFEDANASKFPNRYYRVISP